MTVSKEFKEREHAIYKVTWIGFFVNLLLSIAKILAGIFGRSGAMIADGIHSISDFLTDLVVLVFVKVSSKPKDETHDYGHGKYETLASVIIGIALGAVAIGILVDSIEKIKSVIGGVIIPRPGLIALLAAVISIACKEGLYWYTMNIANRYNSPVVKANAWHHRSDAFSSIGTLIGIGGAYFLGEHWRILDPIAAIVVSILIGKVAYQLIKTGVDELLEHSLPIDDELKIEQLVLQDNTFQNMHDLKTRRVGNSVVIEMHLLVRGDMSVTQSHQATEEAEERPKVEFGNNTQITIHIEPE